MLTTRQSERAKVFPISFYPYILGFCFTMEGNAFLMECNTLKTNDGYVCTAKFANFAAVAKNCELGTSFSTDVFTMDFPDSFGSSSWEMIIFPHGQFNARGYSNGKLSAYIKLISVEKENETLFVDIALKICGKYPKLLMGFNQSFSWNLKSTRWYGGKLIQIEDVGNTPVVQCILKVKSSMNTFQFPKEREKPLLPASSSCGKFK